MFSLPHCSHINTSASRTAPLVPLLGQSISLPINFTTAQLWDLVLAPLMLFNSLKSSQLKNQSDNQAGIITGVRSDWRTLCNAEDCPIGSGPRYEMSLCSTHSRAVVTSHTWVLCFCIKYHGSWVTFSCCSGTHFVPYHLIPALFKCLTQHPRSRGKIKALNLRNSLAESAVHFWLSPSSSSSSASPASFGLLIYQHSHNAPVT